MVIFGRTAAALALMLAIAAPGSRADATTTGLPIPAVGFAPAGPDLLRFDTGGSLQARIPMQGAVYSVALSRDGATVWTLNSVGDVVPIDVASGQPGAKITTGAQEGRITTSPDGRLALITNRYTDTVLPVDLANGKVLAAVTVAGHPYDVVFSKDVTTAYVVGTDAATQRATFTTVDVATWTVSNSLVVGGKYGYSIVLAPNGRTAYVSAQGHSTGESAISLVDLTSGSWFVMMDPGPVFPGPMAVTPNGKDLFVGIYTTQGAKAMKLGLATGARSDYALQLPSAPTALRVTPDGAAVVGAHSAFGGYASVIATDDGRPLARFAPDAGTWGAASDVEIVPSQGPTARLTATARRAGSYTRLSAAASRPGTTPISAYFWDYGDGTTAVTPDAAVIHRYQLPGTYVASVRVQDKDETSTKFIYSGTPIRNGSPAAKATITIDVPSG